MAMRIPRMGEVDGGVTWDTLLSMSVDVCGADVLVGRRRPADAAVEPLDAVIFDLDGALADVERDGQRLAFNAAFAEHGLDISWTVEELRQAGLHRRRTAAHRLGPA